MKILSVGNSFSQDATRYLHQIANADNFELKTVNLFIGGCSLERHVNNIRNDIRDYSLEIDGECMGKYVSVAEALAMDEYDYITVQQVSQLSVNYNTYQPYLKELSDYLKEKAPNSRQVVHQTWAYEQGSERLCTELGYKEQADMYNDLKNAYEQAAKDLGGLRIIPCGTAFQCALKGGMEKIHRDTFHALIPQGRYILAGVWYEFFSGNSVVGNTYCPEGMEKEELPFLQQYVHNAFNV